MFQIAISLIKQAEGFSPYEYVCPAGYASIGYGQNLKYYPLSQKVKERGFMLENEANEFLEMQIDDSETFLANNFPWFQDLDVVRKAVLVDFVYNIGNAKFKTFKNMIDALNKKDYAKAAYEMEHGSGKNGKSKYYNSTGRRAKRNIAIMKSGILKDGDI